MLTQLTNDPRDLVECRVHEAQLAEEVAALTQRLASSSQAAASDGDREGGAAPMDTFAAAASCGSAGSAGSAALGSLWRQRAEVQMPCDLVVPVALHPLAPDNAKKVFGLFAVAAVATVHVRQLCALYKWVN